MFDDDKQLSCDNANFSFQTQVFWRNVRFLSHLIPKMLQTDMRQWLNRKVFRLKLDSSVKYDTCCTEYAKHLKRTLLSFCKFLEDANKKEQHERIHSMREKTVRYQCDSATTHLHSVFTLFIYFTFFSIFTVFEVSVRPFFSNIPQKLNKNCHECCDTQLFTKHTTVDSCETPNVSFVELVLAWCRSQCRRIHMYFVSFRSFLVLSFSSLNCI